mgnify:CR=1 FL=1
MPSYIKQALHTVSYDLLHSVSSMLRLVPHSSPGGPPSFPWTFHADFTAPTGGQYSLVAQKGLCTEECRQEARFFFLLIRTVDKEQVQLLFSSRKLYKILLLLNLLSAFSFFLLKEKKEMNVPLGITISPLSIPKVAPWVSGKLNKRGFQVYPKVKIAWTLRSFCLTG